MFSQTVNRYTAGMVYEQAYSLDFNWQKHLPEEVFKYHDLLWKETNAPIDLHMGVVLPFVASCLGPKTRGHFLTRPSVLNLFWINVAASGVGKSITRQKFISQPMDYILKNATSAISNFEISRFTRAGMYTIIEIYTKKLNLNICIEQIIVTL